MKKTSVIYIHKNKTNEKVYVGQTNDVSKRWAGQGTHYMSCPKFWKAICKYGWDGFDHIILEENLTIEEANQKEAEYIKIFDSINNGYNIAAGGANAEKPYLSEYMKEKWKEPEYRAKKIASLSGENSHFYGSDKKGENNPMWGKHHSQETKDLISQKAKERHQQNPDMVKGKNNPMSKQVICLTTGQIFDCQKDAADWAQVGTSTMSRWLKGKTKTTGVHPETKEPLQWAYYIEEERK